MIRGIRTSEFWTSLAVSLGAFSSVVGTVFDKTFVSNHPALAAAVTVASVLTMAISQASYAISRGLAKSADTTTVPVVTANAAQG